MPKCSWPALSGSGIDAGYDRMLIPAVGFTPSNVRVPQAFRILDDGQGE